MYTIPHLILSKTVLFLLYRWSNWHLRRPESCERSHLPGEVAWRCVCLPDLHSYQHCIAHVDIPKGAGGMKEGIGSASLSTEQGTAEVQMGTKCFSKNSVPKARWDRPAVRDKFSITGEVVTTSHSLFSAIKILWHGGTWQGNNNSLAEVTIFFTGCEVHAKTTLDVQLHGDCSLFLFYFSYPCLSTEELGKCLASSGIYFSLVIHLLL